MASTSPQTESATGASSVRGAAPATKGPWWRGAIPPALRGYQPSWLRLDIIAGCTLAAVAIPETMGYASIAQVPVIAGLYTVIFPTVLFALFGSSKLLVVGADSATAAILAAGLASFSLTKLVPGSAQWLAMTSLAALIAGGMLVVARLLRLGFLGDFLSASVLVGFLSGVGVQVFSGQLPEMLGIPKPSGNWFQRMWGLISHLGDTNMLALAFALGTIVIILAFKRWAPVVPGAIVAVVLSIIISAALNLSQHGLDVVGHVPSGFPPIGLPSGVGWKDVPPLLGIAFSCFVLIIAQSAATSRSFAVRHGDRVDIDRDIVGLAAANLAAGLTGTFVVNGSPTKTQILDEQRGRTQVANLTMSAVVLIIVMFVTGLLTDMPKAVLGAIVFLIGVDLVDVKGLRELWTARRSEFVIAAVTGVVVFAWGVEQGIILAVLLSILEMVRRQYRPERFVIGMRSEGGPTYIAASPGTESLPGLLVFRYDADLFYANANRFFDDVSALMTSTPHPVRWLVLDCSAIPDVDYSAGNALKKLIAFVHANGAILALASVDPDLGHTLTQLGVRQLVHDDHVFPTVLDAASAFLQATGQSLEPLSATATTPTVAPATQGPDAAQAPGDRPAPSAP
jgi:high affinity sulfate transporter 1